MEVLNLIRLFGGAGFPLHKPYPYSLHRDSSLHFRYLKCLLIYRLIIFDYAPAMRVFPKIRGTPKWMVYKGKPY